MLIIYSIEKNCFWSLKTYLAEGNGSKLIRAYGGCLGFWRR